MHDQRSAQMSAQTSAIAEVERRKPYRVAEVAELLDVHESTVYRDIDEGRLRALRVGAKRGALRIMPADFAVYLANMATAGSAVAA